MAVELPWPEDPDRVRARVTGLVESLVGPDELTLIRLQWAAAPASRFRQSESGGPALRLRVVAAGDETWEDQIWPMQEWVDWEWALAELASRLEDWVCETCFAWGQMRIATVPD